jgi:Ca2+-binding EF-hand superfamily protein
MKAHILAALVFPLLTFTPQPSGAGQTAEPQQRMRFAAMDENGDGRITRAEWRGGARAFRNHDWNGDGVLSGDEVRIGAVRQRGNVPDDDGFYDWTRRGFRSVDRDRDNRISRNEWTYDHELFTRADRNRDNVLTLTEFLGSETMDLDYEDRFGDLDTNDNGTIEPREWHGTAEAFSWLDRNDDGRLTRAETVGNDAAVGTSGRDRVAREQVTVSAARQWNDTGIDVRAGDIVRLEADGSVTLSSDTDVADPGGARSGRRAAGAPFPQHPAGSLIGRIGDSEPFYIGDRTSLGRAPASGRLFLGVNDDHFPDNDGYFRVTISVSR